MRVRGLVLGSAVLLALAACAEAPPERAGSEAAPGPVRVALPELPPKWVLMPEFWNEQGCAILSEDKVVCPAPPLPGEEAEEDPGDPRVWRELLGFDGPYYVGVLRAGALVLLPESITTGTGPEGTWRAFGLVRNETTEPVGADVTATLTAADGSVLEEVRAHVLVDPMRPGEPGPFVLASKTPAGKVQGVSWSVEETPPGELVVRDLMVGAPVWQLPYGDRDWREDLDAPGPPPYPYVALGYVTNLSGLVEGTPALGVRQPLVVAAWLDRERRVVWVTTALVGVVPNNAGASAAEPDDLPDPRSGGAFFLVVSDSGIGPRLTDLDLMVWAGSSGYVEPGP